VRRAPVSPATTSQGSGPLPSRTSAPSPISALGAIAPYQPRPGQPRMKTVLMPLGEGLDMFEGLVSSAKPVRHTCFRRYDIAGFQGFRAALRCSGPLDSVNPDRATETL